MQQTAEKGKGTSQQSLWVRFLKNHGSILFFAVLFVVSALFIPNFITARNVFILVGCVLGLVILFVLIGRMTRVR